MSKPVVLIDAGELVGLSGSADGDVLKWNADTSEWEAAPGAGTGTVTSVTLDTDTTGLTVSGETSQEITGAGTFTLGGTLSAANGGTGLGAPAGGDVGKVLTAAAGGGYELVTPEPGGVTSIDTGEGLTGGPITDTGTISLEALVVDPSGTKGSATTSAVVTVDAYGRTTSLTDIDIQLASTSKVDGLDTALSGKVPTSRNVNTTAGQLEGGGALSSDLTLSLATVGTAASNQGSATQTVTVSTDAYGRVTSLSQQAISGLGAGVISSGEVATARGGTGLDASGATDGEVLIGQSTGSFALHALSQDATMAKDGKVTVQGLQARAVSSVAPTSGQTLVWSTSGGGAWVPGSQASGGSGGGGVLYYMNAGTSVPATNGIPAGTYQLGRTAEGGSHPISLTNVDTGVWTRVGGFVSDASDPNLTSIPAGIWDFNVWASSTANANNMFFRLTFYAYDGSTNPESGAALATSVTTYLYDPSVPTQYTTSFALAQTAFTGKRIYIRLDVQASAASKNVEFGFGDGQASHVHTTVPSVTGSGFVKVLDGVIVPTGQTVDLGSSTDVGDSVLGVANGGTGASSLTEHALLVGQGSAAIGGLVGTTAGEVVRWNGTDWTASALSSNAVTSITGTTDQVIASASVGAVTLSLPQSIAADSSPTFAGLTLSSFNGLVRATSGVLAGGAEVTGSDFGSQTAKYVFAAPNAENGTPLFRPLEASDLPSLTGTYLPLAGGTMSAGSKLIVANSTSTKAGFSFGPTGTAPSSPVTGDVWVQNDNRIYVSLNGTQYLITSAPSQPSTIQPLAQSSGAGLTFAITGGNTSFADATAGALTFSGGNATGTGATTGGGLTLRGGTGVTNGTVSLGTTQTSAITVGAAGVTTTFSGRVVTPALTASAAGFNIVPTAATPTTLADGDMWVTSVGVFARVNGVTQQLVSGSFLPLAGGTMSAGSKLTVASSTTAGAGFSLGSTLGLVPTTPAQGDIWTQSDGGVFVATTGVSQRFITSAPTASVTIQPGASTVARTISLTGGATSAVNGTGGNVTISGGTANVATSTSGAGGALNLRGGAGIVANGAVNIGDQQTSGVNIGASAITTNVLGTLTASTASAGTNTTQVATTAFTTTAVANAVGSPYDLSGDAYGALASNQTIFRFLAPRNLTLTALTSGSGVTAVKVQVNDADVTYPVNVASGAKITVLTTASGTDAYFTITGKVA